MEFFVALPAASRMPSTAKPHCDRLRKAPPEPGHLMQYATPPPQPHHAFDQHTLTSLDNQPYGCIKLDKTGRVLEFNIAASAVLGVRAKDAIGKHFFTEVARCADNPEFYGRFKTAMAGTGVLNKVIDHRFVMSEAAQAMGGVLSIDVRVHMFSSTDNAGLPVVWIVTRKRVDALSSRLSDFGALSGFGAVSGFGTQPARNERQSAAASQVAPAASAPAQRRTIQSISSDFDMSI